MTTLNKIHGIKPAIKIVFFSFFLNLLLLSSCKTNISQRQSENQQPANNFEFYKKKYAKAVAYYSTPKDSLKLKALNFILKNLDDQYFFKAAYIDAYDESIFQTKNITLSDLTTKLDSIRRIYPDKSIKIKDASIITDNYLIDNIERAFETRKYAWTKGVDFNDFCEYVLPYKGGNERPEYWRVAVAKEIYLNVDSLSHITNPFDAASYVNNHLGWFKVALDYNYPADIGYQMSKRIKTGTCSTASMMSIFPMRTLGLPVVIDFARSWGNRSFGHNWDALIYKNHTYPLDVTGPNIGFYKIEFKGTGRMPYKISKIFRLSFSVQSDNLASINRYNEEVPEFLKSKRLKDVTDAYVPTSNVSLFYSSRLLNKFAYLCTFDNQDWVPSYWGKVNNNGVTFSKMGRDIVYLPALYSNKTVRPIGNPFILMRNGNAKELVANRDNTQTMIITKKYPEDESNNIYKGNKYELFYWQSGWNSLGVQIATSDTLYYRNAPTNALYWIRNLTEGKQERIFTYENNKQIWW